MKTLKLVDGDLSFSDIGLEMVDGKDEIAQSLRIILATRLGEFYLDDTVGLDTSVILTKGFDEGAAHDAIIDALMQDGRVVEVTDISFAVQGRSLSVDISLMTTDGDPVTIDNVPVGGGSSA